LVAFDANGNVAGLVGGSSGTNSAVYEYGPFGEATRLSGSAATLNPFRFSAKYTDVDSDLVYYGYRYCNSLTGRWLSRDPLAERGAKTLYVWARNDPLNWFDVLGLDPVGDWISGIY